MFRKSFLVTSVLIMCVLVAVMIVLGGCLSTLVPMITPVPIATWVAQGVPADTVISYNWWSEMMDSSDTVDIRADGNKVTCESRKYDTRVTRGGQISQDELRQIVLKVAEVDFFTLATCGEGCVYYVTHPIRVPTPHCFATDSNYWMISLKINGKSHGIKLSTSPCGVPGDSQAHERLGQLVRMVLSVCDRFPTPTPTTKISKPTPTP